MCMMNLVTDERKESNLDCPECPANLKKECCENAMKAYNSIGNN